MKILEIVGENYSGITSGVRRACRGIVTDGSRILMSRETVADQWMIPGGGMEEGETAQQCAEREVAEETGYEVEAYEPVLEVDEYYEEMKYETLYFRCRIIGRTETHLTQREMDAGAVPFWADRDEMIEIFSHHEEFAEENEMKRGLYQREFTALKEIFRSRDGGIRRVDDELELVPYYPAEHTALEWYRDPELCRQVDNIDRVYDIDMLRRMYGYLDVHGDCFYIRYNGMLVGDISLLDIGETAIVVSRDYQNRHIGRRCITEIIKLAREKGFSEVTARIYSFNEQSRRMFESAGFRHEEGDIWVKETD
ncbi:MAG: GNAT family N-acetyltransferase [Oscillospiraceae bacterium]|nr:GNAT family N-acetyltransferase [Oscillospiraceae bacterium]